MKKLLAAVIVLVVFFSSAILVNAQEVKKTGLEEGTLSSQFDYVIKKSSTHEAFQVVRRAWLYELKGNALDSVKVLHEGVVSLETKVQEQQKEINVLKLNLKETNKNLAVVSKEKDSFNFAGMLLTKGFYSTMVWVIIFVLFVLLLLMMFLFKRSNTLTVKTKDALSDKQEEFDAHRKWALEREQSLARDLNKLKQKYKGLD